ncbi:MAG: efflux RND transporter periplasmic adaptor subunit [Candidatus Nitrospinota bacterium M3_3B_026]
MTELEKEAERQRPGWVYALKFAWTLILALLVVYGYFNREAVLEWFKDPAFSLPGREKVEKAAPAPAAEKGRKIKYWRAPMDPSYISDEPGKSPMGMDLIPVYEDEGEDADVIRINPAVVQNIGVRTASARRMDMVKTIRAIGVIAYDETKLNQVHSKVPGWVEKLYVDATGMELKKDEYLLEIYSPDLVATQEEYLLALNYRDSLREGGHEAAAGSGERLLESARRRLELFDVPQHQIMELEESREVKKTLHIHSPADGVVVSKKVIEGMYVKPGDTLYELADLSTVWVYVDVYEYEIPYVKEGQSAEMTLTAFPGRVFKGKITYIYPFLDKRTRSIKARLEFRNPGTHLKPDMYGDVTIHAEGRKNAVAVPSEAVIRTGERTLVFIDRGEGMFEPREVNMGMESEGMVAILDGVKPGEMVVTSAQFLLDSESRLREATRKMIPAGEEMKTPEEAMPMDHGAMESGKMSQPGMDHGSMNHEGMDRSKMNH